MRPICLLPHKDVRVCLISYNEQSQRRQSKMKLRWPVTFIQPRNRCWNQLRLPFWLETVVWQLNCIRRSEKKKLITTINQYKKRINGLYCRFSCRHFFSLHSIEQKNIVFFPYFQFVVTRIQTSLGWPEYRIRVEIQMGMSRKKGKFKNYVIYYSMKGQMREKK